MYYSLLDKQIEELMLLPKDGGLYTKPGSSIQWKFTPYSSVESFFKTVQRLKNKTICVILNVENVHRLKQHGIDLSKVYFISDCEVRYVMAIEIGIKKENIFKVLNRGNKYFMEKDFKIMFDQGIMNPDFGNTPALRKLAESICRNLTMISDTNHFTSRLENFEKVEQFENLGGGAFEDAKVSTCIVKINPNKKDHKLKIIGANKDIIYDGIPRFVPGRDVDEFIWADAIVKMNLPGFDANCGDLYTADVLPPKKKDDKISLIFTVGKNNETSFGRMLSCDRSQLQDATGYGSHKVVMSKSTSLSKIGPLKYAGPEYGCGHNCVSIICESEQQAKDTIEYLNSDKVKRLVKVLKTSGAINTKGIFRKIPNLLQKSKWN
jgi:hypothetical protein